MPTSLYGLGDNYHPENSHVISALIRRFHEAKVSNAPEVVIWGTGTPKREFLYVDDMALASVFVMQLHKVFLISKPILCKTIFLWVMVSISRLPIGCGLSPILRRPQKIASDNALREKLGRGAAGYVGKSRLHKGRQGRA